MGTHKNGNHMRKHIIVLGKEIEYFSGMRAVAASLWLGDDTSINEDDLFDICDEVIGNKNLFEGFKDAYNPNPEGPFLGEGCPFSSLEAYVALRKFYGPDWLYRGLVDYAAKFANTKYRSVAENVAKKWWLGAHALFWHEQALANRTPAKTTSKYCTSSVRANMLALRFGAA